MAVKKLYTENYIRNIANSLRQVVGDPSARYNTQEMAATLATIHRGAKDVWIGDQASYNSLTSYDVEICYIIIEHGIIRRVYAGTVILYEETINWDVEILNRHLDHSYIDTGVAIRASEYQGKAFEMIFKATNCVGTYPGYDAAIVLTLPVLDRGDRFHIHFEEGDENRMVRTRFGWDEATYSGDTVQMRVTKDENELFTIYREDQGTSELWATKTYSQTELTETLIIGSAGPIAGSGVFDLEYFKFRVIEE